MHRRLARGGFSDLHVSRQIALCRLLPERQPPKQATIDTGTPFPTKDNFETCLEAWCQYRGWEGCSDCQRAELLLLKMKELSDAGHDLAPDSNTIRRVVEACGQAPNVKMQV
jgi:hypothetical protein